MLGWNPESRLTFVREYAGLAEWISGAVKRYASDVQQGALPVPGGELSRWIRRWKKALEKKYGTHRQD